MLFEMTRNSRTGKRVQYASMLESFLAFFVLLLIFFGLLQLYRLTLANMVSEYAAFRGARSSAVGFDDTLVAREARVKTIPVSGHMISPQRSLDIGDPKAQFYHENRAIERYMDGTQYLNYAYWYGERVRHNNYKCEHYGEYLDSGYCSVCSAGATGSTSLSIDQKADNETTTVNLTFINYPLDMPFYKAFTSKGYLTIRTESELTNHANVY